MDLNPISIIILAAGKGTRMHSALPKALHPIAGKPMLQHILLSAAQLSPKALYCVVGHGQERVKSIIPPMQVLHYVEQTEQLGTAHAVAQALPAISQGRVLILCGDVPLIREQTLKAFLEAIPQSALGVVTYHLDNPTGFGRVLRDASGAIQAIVEEKDATPEQRAIQEVSSGIFVADAEALKRWIPAIKADNRAVEYYLPDIVPLAVRETAVQGFLLKEAQELMGVNDKAQLAMAERAMQMRQAQALMQSGVTLMDPARYDQRGTVTAGKDVTIDIDCIFEGTVVLGEGSRVGAHCILKDVTLGKHCEILPHTIIDGAILADQVSVGPFARIRPGTVLSSEVKIGNFVEVKNTQIGEGSKANHLSYLGDAQLGADVNIGAGTITCNFNGVTKSSTLIADGAFIGSNVSLVAPVDIGENAVIGAGSVITKDAPGEQLTVARAKQTTVPNWHRPAGSNDDKE